MLMVKKFTTYLDLFDGYVFFDNFYGLLGFMMHSKPSDIMKVS